MPQNFQLKFASSCLEHLLSSNEALKIELIRKYLDDVICAMEQVIFSSKNFQVSSRIFSKKIFKFS